MRPTSTYREGDYFSEGQPYIDISTDNLAIIDYLQSALEQYIADMVNDSEFVEVEEAAHLLNQLTECSQKLELEMEGTPIEDEELEVAGDDKPMSEL